MRRLIALVLMVGWPAVTSHILLEQGGLIHVVHDDHGPAHPEHHGHDADRSHDEHHDGDAGSHEHNGENHAFADGDYRSTIAGKLLLKPQLIAVCGIFASVASMVDAAELKVRAPGPAPPGSTPQILQQSWQFSERAAIPGRAPSFRS